MDNIQIESETIDISWQPQLLRSHAFIKSIDIINSRE